MDPSPVTARIHGDLAAKLRWFCNRRYNARLKRIVDQAVEDYLNREIAADPNLSAEWQAIEIQLKRHLRAVP